jgi:Uma2 family endonuclease
MATNTIPKKMTAEQFFVWANNPKNGDRKWELEDGKVVEMPSPGERHAFVCWLAICLMSDYVRSRGIGYLLTNDCGLIVRRRPDTVRGPDIMLFLERGEVTKMNAGFCDKIPALIIEILSPSDTMRKTTVRVNQYLKRGVRLIWVIDPVEQIVYIHRPEEFGKVLDDSEELTGNGILPDFRCKVSEFFTSPPAIPARPRKGNRE